MSINVNVVNHVVLYTRKEQELLPMRGMIGRWHSGGAVGGDASGGSQSVTHYFSGAGVLGFNFLYDLRFVFGELTGAPPANPYGYLTFAIGERTNASPLYPYIATGIVGRIPLTWSALPATPYMNAPLLPKYIWRLNEFGNSQFTNYQLPNTAGSLLVSVMGGYLYDEKFLDFQLS